jgi:ribonucleoside-diphosphate reductase alpha chain
MFLDNTACNLASLNLVNALLRNINKDPLNEDILDLKRFEHATRIWTVVLDISVSMASFPSREIALGSYNYRTLGLGYANVGGLLHRLGLSYDSDEGRNLIAALTALMHGQAYLTSSQLAFELGSFPRWEVNRDSMAKVLQKHKDAVKNLSTEYYIAPIVARALTVWEPLGGGCAFRNAQVTLLAPTGTISFVMGCETTGIEPFTAPTITKSLAGGGEMAIENSVPESECAFPSRPGGPCLRPMAHVLMVAAVQPFLSGAVSKTVNMPNSATVEDVDSVYREAGRLGLKSVAIYRDGSKLSQPLKTNKGQSSISSPSGQRVKLPTS